MHTNNSDIRWPLTPIHLILNTMKKVTKANQNVGIFVLSIDNVVF